jgi:flagellar hook-associated protein 2
MAGTISSLGIGSGVLTADVLDQLREADESRIITPLDNKIELQNQKATAFELLDSLLTTFKSGVSTLSYDTLYQNRTVEVAGGNLEVSAEAGSAVQSFTLETVALAQKNIQQSGTFASEGDAVADPGSSGTMTLSIDGSSFDIAYTDTMTLTELAQAINDEAGSRITASILQTGESAYSLILTSNETGADQTISISDSPAAGTGLVSALTTGMTSVQDADDAEFKYNGITVTRASNEVSDLITGVTLTLKTEGEFANVDITQDQLAVATEMKLFVENYNNLITNLHDMTAFDQENGATGVFNGESFIKSISRAINEIVTSVDGDGNSLVNYGIDIDKNGVMSFDESAFTARFEADPEGLELFFAGGYVEETDETKTGVFDTLNDRLDEYTKYNGLFDTFQASLDTRLESLTDQRTHALETLENRYAILEKQFIAYDAIISKLNAQFTSLQQMIQAELNADDN